MSENPHSAAAVVDYTTSPLRLTNRLYQYWHDCRGINAMPEENDIDPDELGTDWEYCFLLQARDVANIKDYNFTFLGERIVRAYFDTNIDQFNAFLVGPNANCLSDIFSKVINSGAPVYDEGEFQTLHGRTVLFRQCALPLGNPDKGVEAVFGGMNYKIVE